ncbi:secretion regulating guanine nucleotide exchange factor isoform X1 [Neodiprion pinetum]|uniref:secretion regulating guanine nucleotide exchange factor isoform X1 n=1 Tax=Neodiprion pinetum TaxID=441929 RepID=UPI001EE08EC6|nr:secretion-regulating guanine nucleotide exchange factor-like isoform X1 [Neodiprion pinetum]
MKTFHLLSWGANSHRQLGHDVESEQCLIPTAVNLNDPCGWGPRVSDITKMSGGAGHSLILNRQGEVYSCGLNNKHQAGAARTRKYVESLVKIDALREATVVDIACGWDSSMAVDNRGQLYAWGSNAYGQLGAGKTPSQKPAIIHLKETAPDPVADIAMGLRHSALVTTSGNVLVAGYGSKCQLGIIDESNKSLKATDTFTQVPGLTGIKSVACGQHHTIALSKNGDLYAWGDNKHGQLGFDPKIYARLETPLKLENVNVGPDGKIFTGWTHTAVLHDGKVFAWGRNTYGQLGRGADKFLAESQPTWLPKVIKNVPDFVQIAVGSEHNIALAEDGSVMCWGWNEHGNCGNGTVQDVREPVRIDVLKNGMGTLVGTGYGHSFAVVQS